MDATAVCAGGTVTDRGRFNVNRFKTLSGDGRYFELIESVVFDRPPQVGGEQIILPAGALSDGATTPAALWAIGLPPFGDHWRAAFLHDWLYRQTQRPKPECDTIFLEAMLTCGVSYDKARWFYNGVCEAGQHSFQDDRKQRA